LARQQASFAKLKEILTTEPVMLSFPIEGCPYEIYCDASEVGMAAILSQIVDGQEKVLMYASAPFTKSELLYCLSKGMLSCTLGSATIPSLCCKRKVCCPLRLQSSRMAEDQTPGRYRSKMVYTAPTL
jgi:hypothetical protein